MLDRIVIPLDGSPMSDRILVPLLPVLGAPWARVSFLRVLPGPASAAEERRARAVLERIANGLSRSGVPADASVRRGDPVDAILRFAVREKADLIAMFSHGRTGRTRALMGSVAEEVLRRSPVPLFLATPRSVRGRSGGARRFRRILVPLDGAARSRRILPVAAGVAGLIESDLVLFHVLGGSVRKAPSFLRASRERLASAGYRTAVRTGAGAPGRAILRAASDLGADLIAMTTHGRTGRARRLYGSVAEFVLRRATCPLLVLRSPRRGGRRRV